MSKITLEDYLNKREKEFDLLKKEISFLKKIKTPLTIIENGKNLAFLSEDYSLATNFKIEKRYLPCNHGYASTPEGSATVNIIGFYPQFYFNLTNGEKTLPILIQHKNFDEDNKVIFKIVEDVQGSGNWAKETKHEVEYFDVKKMLSYFKKKGVKKEVLEKFESKINELENY
jgi:hypothetical protein